jgi:hypothetical protein
LLPLSKEREKTILETKDKFNLLYASLVDTFKGYVENVMKTLAFIIIALGWTSALPAKRTTTEITFRLRCERETDHRRDRDRVCASGLTNP